LMRVWSSSMSSPSGPGDSPWMVEGACWDPKTSRRLSVSFDSASSIDSGGGALASTGGGALA